MRITLALIAVVNVAACAPMTTEPLSTLRPPAEYDGCSDCSLIVRQMALSIDTEPDLWKTDGYHLSRVDGPTVWIANKDYGIAIGPERYKTTALEPARGPEMQLLWRAFRRWQDSELAKGSAATL